MSTSILSLLPTRSVSHGGHAVAALPTAHENTRHVSSQSLLGGSRELVIQHQGSAYHLRLTRNDKLILTK